MEVGTTTEVRAVHDGQRGINQRLLGERLPTEVDDVARRSAGLNLTLEPVPLERVEGAVTEEQVVLDHLEKVEGTRHGLLGDHVAVRRLHESHHVRHAPRDAHELDDRVLTLVLSVGLVRQARLGNPAATQRLTVALDLVELLDSVVSRELGNRPPQPNVLGAEGGALEGSLKRLDAHREAIARDGGARRVDARTGRKGLVQALKLIRRRRTVEAVDASVVLPTDHVHLLILSYLVSGVLPINGPDGTAPQPAEAAGESAASARTWRSPPRSSRQRWQHRHRRRRATSGTSSPACREPDWR